MVSKVAVIALVAIIAVPICLGYAFNLEETTGVRYQSAGESVNVTPLLSNGTEYSYSTVDPYTLNSQHNLLYEGLGNVYPEYQSFKNVRSAVQLGVTYYGAGQLPGPKYLSSVSTYQAIFDYDDIHNEDYHFVILKIYSDAGGGNLTLQVTANKIVNVILVKTYSDSGILTGSRLYYTQMNNGQYESHFYSNPFYIEYDKANDYSGYCTVYEQDRSNPSGYYADFSAGFVLGKCGARVVQDRFTRIVNNTDSIRDMTLTFNLDSITDSSFLFSMYGSRYHNTPYSGWLEFEKTTTDGVVSWVFRSYGPDHALRDEIDLYINQSGNNTYQMKFDGYGGQLRYVGTWPTVMGEANYYLSYDYTYQDGSFNDSPSFLNYIWFYGRTPIMRIDSATARAFVSNVMEDQTYTPGTFRQNPSTTIEDVKVVGSSITFGGSTFAVSDGKLVIDSHKVPINGLNFISVLTDDGYENRIGNTVISTGNAAPSTITFNGRWGASVSTIGLEEVNYSETKWVPGSFAWDGVDTNFLMAGLLTSFGAFIALGVYARRSGAKVLPLMIVCGGAALMFLVMI